MGSYLSSYKGIEIDNIIDLFLDKLTKTDRGLGSVVGVVQRNNDGSFTSASIPQGTVTSVTAGAGLNTTSDDSGTDGGTITTSGTLYLTKSGATAGNYGDASAQTPTYGGTFKVPYVSVDKYGRVTGISDHTVTIPASDDTTYTFETGTSNGTFKVTPSGGSAQSVSIYGLADSAFTPIADSIASGGTGIPVAGTIFSFVSSAIAALPEPMIFKGSLGEGGTITTLPTAAAENEGFVYKVITEGTYAGIAAKVGDTFICANTGSGTYGWILIPSGDEPSGTVTSVGINGGNSINVSGSPITSSGIMSLSLKLNYTTSGANRAVQADENGNLYVTQRDYTLPLAADGTRGGVQVGYTQSGKNYPVQLSNEKMYVNVPWTDTTYTFTDSDAILDWDTKTKIATVGGTDIHVTMPEEPVPNDTPMEKDITVYFEDGTLSDRIAGTNGFKPFEGITVGSYIDMGRNVTCPNIDSGSSGATGSRYVTVVDLNGLYGNGDNGDSVANITFNHLVMVPGKGFGGTQHFGQHRMNATDTTANGYFGSVMHGSVLGAVATTGSIADGATINQQLKYIFGDHLVTTRELLSTAVGTTLTNRYGSATGASNSWAWKTCQAVLMSEAEVYGTTAWSSSGYDTGNAHHQFMLFQLVRSAINNRTAWYWLKDVVSASLFARSGGNGDASSYSASNTGGGVRPRFCIK